MATALGASLGPVLTISACAPSDIAAKPGDAIVDDSTPIYNSEAEKIGVVIYATFELQ